MSKQPKKNLLSLKQIERIVGALPEKDLLAVLWTSDQLQHWLQHRSTYTAVISAWTAKRKGTNDPINPLLKSGQISKNDYDRIWALEYWLECLEAVIYWTEPLLRKSFAKAGCEYPFKNRAELFAHLLQEHAAGDFSACLDKYREIPGGECQRKYKAVAGLLRGALPTKSQEKEFFGVEPTDEKRREALVEKALYKLERFRCPSYLAVISVACEGAKSNWQLKRDLKNFVEAAAQLADREATHHRIQGSIAWVDGHKVQASKDGTYQSP